MADTQNVLLNLVTSVLMSLPYKIFPSLLVFDAFGSTYGNIQHMKEVQSSYERHS